MILRLESRKHQGLIAAWQEEDKMVVQLAYKDGAGWHAVGLSASEKVFDPITVSDGVIERLEEFISVLLMDGLHQEENKDDERSTES